MAITEDTAALVAAQLTVAHASFFGPIPNVEGQAIAEVIQETVGNVYEQYLRRVREGDIHHLIRPAG